MSSAVLIPSLFCHILTLGRRARFGNLVFVSGQVPFVNGTIAEGGIKNETAVCLERVGEILKEAGTDWSKVLKVNVFLQGQSVDGGNEKPYMRGMKTANGFQSQTSTIMLP